MDSYIIGNTRFSLLSDGLVRMEYAPDGRFEDRVSVRAMHRPAAIPFESVEQQGDRYILKGGNFRITHAPHPGGFGEWSLFVHDRQTRELVWQTSFEDDRNLGGVYRSLDRFRKEMVPDGVEIATREHFVNDESCGFGMFKFDGKDHEETATRKNKYPPGILSRRGYFVYNDTPTDVLDEDGWICKREAADGYEDIYIFLYRQDYAQALRDYRLLFGPTALPPRYMLGLWYSRFPTLKAAEIEEAIANFEQHDLPLDVFVLDLEWHKRGWHGFDWDTDEYGDPETFLGGLRDRDIRITANIHPDMVPVEDSRFDAFCEAAGIDPAAPEANVKVNRGVEKLVGFSLADRRVADAWMKAFHEPIENAGLDFWWQDGGSYDHLNDTYNQLWTNHVYMEHARNEHPDRRPMVFSRSSGLGSHRYPVHFTGDTYTQWEVLRSEIEYTLRAGHMGLSLVSHDISGFSNQCVQPPDDLYARWVQFGVFSPIFRLHSSGGEERRPWLFNAQALESFKRAIRERMQLLPYIYSAARESYDTCMPICRSNPIMCPEWDAGYRIWDSYFFGDRIYVAPITERGDERSVTLPPGCWYDALNQTVIDASGTDALRISAPLEAAPPHFVKAGSLLVTQPYALRAARIPQELVCTWYGHGRPAQDRYTLYEDDGYSRAHEQGHSSRIVFETSDDGAGTLVIQVAAGESYPGAPENRVLRVRLATGLIASATVNGNAAAVEDGQVTCSLVANEARRIVLHYEQD